VFAYALELKRTLLCPPLSFFSQWISDLEGVLLGAKKSAFAPGRLFAPGPIRSEALSSPSLSLQAVGRDLHHSEGDDRPEPSRATGGHPQRAMALAVYVTNSPRP